MDPIHDKKFTVKITGENYNITETIDKAQLAIVLPVILGSYIDPSSSTNPNIHTFSKKQSKGHKIRHSTNPVNVRPVIENLNIEPVSDKFGNYWNLSKKGERLLWILANLAERNIESANQKELSLIAKKLADNIPARHISAFLDFHKKKGRIAPSLEDSVRMVRILKPGIDYISELNAGGSGRVASPSAVRVD